MTREEAKRRAGLYSALADGKTIQVLMSSGEWKDVEIDDLTCISENISFRIKPEPKYRPFKNQEECWQEMLKHQPFGWIYSKNESCYYCIISIEEDKIELSPREQSRSEEPPKEYYLENDYCFFDIALETFEYTFADGTPFGIRED